MLETVYNEEDFKRFEQVFRTMTSFREDESIEAGGLSIFLKTIDYDCTPEQVENYVEFHNKTSGGKLYLNDFLRYIATQHDPNQMLREMAITFDKDKDGFISESAYMFAIEVLRVHDPEVVGDKVVSYMDFVKEADTNKDRKVSIDELTNWLKNKSSN